MTSRSVVEYFGPHERYNCGYCHSSDTSYSHGMWGHYLTPQDYEDLINRGWRRSGNYCYKPMLKITCCPQYAIKCEALKFKLSKSQKKILKRMKHFLTQGRDNADTLSISSTDEQDQPMDCPHMPDIDINQRKNAKDEVDGFLNQNLQPSCDQPSTKISNEDPSCSVGKMECEIPVSAPIKAINSGEGADPNKPICKKAKHKRREKYRQKLLNAGKSPEEIEKLQIQKSNEKSLEEFLAEAEVDNPIHRLELRLVPSDLSHPEFSKTFDRSYIVYQKYQTTIHRDSPERCTNKQFKRFLITNPFQHPDSPFYGSYHQQYWLDDKLIAVGVLDVLPHCLSSVYLFYDPDYSFLSLGTYAALREIALVRELNKTHPELKYYYMGFYIHSCPKMRYKGAYSPSYLLCPETYKFKPIHLCLPKLNQSKYSRLEDKLDEEDTDGVVNLNEVMILYKKLPMPYEIYASKSKGRDESIITQYASLVGTKCYRRMLLYRAS